MSADKRKTNECIETQAAIRFKLLIRGFNKKTKELRKKYKGLLEDE